MTTQTIREMILVFEECYKQNPDKYITKQQIIEIVKTKGIIPYLDFNTRGDQIKFAIRIDKFAKSALSNIYMEVDNVDQRASRRKYKFAKELPKVV